MTRGIALTLLAIVAWALAGTWYYDCKIKRVCGPAGPAAVPVATSATDELLLEQQEIAQVAASATGGLTAALAMTSALSVASPSTAQPVAPVEAEIPRDGVTQLVLTVSFDSRSAAIQPPQDVADRLQVLREGVSAGQKILVLGHSDAVGARDRIAIVSLERAQALRGWLLAKGFAEDALLPAESREDREPVADNGRASGRAQNRRAEALLISLP